MEQLVILVIIGLISLVNWLLQRSAELREKRKLEQAAQRGETTAQVSEPVRADTSHPPREEDPAESMRKLMEALGLPMEEPPPKALQEALPPEPEPFIPPPPLPAQLPRIAFKPTPAPPRPRQAAAIVSREKPSRFRELLSSKAGIRDALVLSEILGKPKGML